jgi:hypothetical protein
MQALFPTDLAEEIAIASDPGGRIKRRSLLIRASYWKPRSSGLLALE